MIETDAERLEMLRGFPGLGSVVAKVNGNDLDGLYDAEFIDLSVGAIDVQDSTPALLCLESDAKRLDIAKGTPVSIPDEGEFQVKQVLPRPPDQGYGFTRLLLSS